MTKTRIAAAALAALLLAPAAAGAAEDVPAPVPPVERLVQLAVVDKITDRTMGHCYTDRKCENIYRNSEMSYGSCSQEKGKGFIPRDSRDCIAVR
ncbi:hypothetical protein [Caenispirillum bisanense]|uniref:YARHG domain-containing protein n=1 Tax=Caenispirillum bisanense TaxID=414052 RepID=A0A286GYE1_9PROT|nr:hypothetical protein [Caenispirillum bisanense]SOE00109.1 hypothetical protein SAMN05421508_11186 [Caenispirillum bisanense]